MFWIKRGSIFIKNSSVIKEFSAASLYKTGRTLKFSLSLKRKLVNWVKIVGRRWGRLVHRVNRETSC